MWPKIVFITSAPRFQHAVHSDKRKMMKANSSSSASPNSTFELIPEESEAGKAIDISNLVAP
jgi:hypothetical protein